MFSIQRDLSPQVEFPPNPFYESPDPERTTLYLIRSAVLVRPRYAADYKYSNRINLKGHGAAKGLFAFPINLPRTLYRFLMEYLGPDYVLTDTLFGGIQFPNIIYFKDIQY